MSKEEEKQRRLLLLVKVLYGAILIMDQIKVFYGEELILMIQLGKKVELNWVMVMMMRLPN